MYERKESKSGSYYPAFLCLDVDTQDDLYYFGRYPIEEKSEAVFLHEFIHYLQDLTTVAGLARIETIVEEIKNEYSLEHLGNQHKEYFNWLLVQKKVSNVSTNYERNRISRW